MIGTDEHSAVPKDFWGTALETHGQKIALLDESGANVSYVELAERADAFARRIGAEPQLVLLEARNDVESVVTIIGCLRGRHPLILSKVGGADRLAHTFRPAAIVDDGGLRMQAVGGGGGLHPDLALMLSTSGSTGATKLVRLARRAVAANAASIVDYLEIGDGDRALTSLPISYSYGLSVLHSHLAAGASVVLTDRSVIDDKLWDLFRKTEATGLAGVPYTYELLEALAFRDLELPNLRTMTQAGGRLSSDLVSTYHEWAIERGVRFLTMYGQTEATARMAYMPPEHLGEHPDCIGRAIPGGSIRLINTDGEEVARGQTGELVYAGDNIMMGYASGPDDLARGHELAELRTGDLAQQVTDDLFRIVGRSSRFSKIAGLRVSLDEIEIMLAGRGIASTVAGDDTLIAIAVADEALIDTAKQAVADHVAIPARSSIVFALGEMPRLASGKIDYPQVLAAGRTAHAAAEATSSATGASLFSAAYARALNRREVGEEDSFASLGGDSFAYIEVSMAIEQELGHLPDHWEQLSLRDLGLLATAGPPKPLRRNSRSVAGEMLIRPIAITFIVAGHIILWGGHDDALYKGGAMALLLAAGYNSARFQRDTLQADSRWKLIGQFFGRFLIPYYILLAVEHILPHQDVLSASKLALLGSYFPPGGVQVRRYWFIEAMFQLLLIMVLLFSVTAFRRAAMRHRWRVGMALLAVATIFKFAVPVLASPEFLAATPHRLDVWAYVFALGWLMADAQSRSKRLFCLALGVVLCGLDWGFIESHTAMLIGAITLILFVPRIRLPTKLANFMAFFAQSTFYIYLSNNLAFSIATNELHIRIPAVLLVVCLGAGMAAFVIWRQMERKVAERFHRWRSLPQHSATDL